MSGVEPADATDKLSHSQRHHPANGSAGRAKDWVNWSCIASRFGNEGRYLAPAPASPSLVIAKASRHDSDDNDSCRTRRSATPKRVRGMKTEVSPTALS